jgi:hypothetical protein
MIGILTDWSPTTCVDPSYPQGSVDGRAQCSRLAGVITYLEPARRAVSDLAADDVDPLAPAAAVQLALEA